jgi:hypothetical protein
LTSVTEIIRAIQAAHAADPAITRQQLERLQTAFMAESTTRKQIRSATAARYDAGLGTPMDVARTQADAAIAKQALGLVDDALAALQQPTLPSRDELAGLLGGDPLIAEGILELARFARQHADLQAQAGSTRTVRVRYSVHGHGLSAKELTNQLTAALLKADICDRVASDGGSGWKIKYRYRDGVWVALEFSDQQGVLWNWARPASTPAADSPPESSPEATPPPRKP